MARKQYSAWLSALENEIASPVSREAYRKYFDAGLSPVEAVLTERAEFLADEAA